MLSAFASAPHWLAVLLTFALVMAVVVMHYEVLARVNVLLPRWRQLPPRTRVLVVMITLVLLHVVEIWIFGVGIYAVNWMPSLGLIHGVERLELLDAVYLSATTYTTLGFGDLVPHGPIRFLVGTEALAGLLLITWSASFTYLEMQRDWRG
nr:two pore domain potassium channel family protein [Oceanococcus sp. HetDA_MAG_MS8]